MAGVELCHAEYPFVLPPNQVDDAIDQLRLTNNVIVDTGDRGAEIIGTFLARLALYLNPDNMSPAEAAAYREQFRRPDKFAGPREPGAANSGTDGKPNLNLSWIWRPDSAAPVPRQEEVQELIDSFEQWFRLSSGVFIPIINRIQERLGGTQNLDYRRLTLGQGNMYVEGYEAEFYQPEHDDMDAGTTLVTDAEGLEVFNPETGLWEKRITQGGQVAVFFGEQMRLFTGGRAAGGLDGLQHRVRNLGNPSLPDNIRVPLRKAGMVFFYLEAARRGELTEPWAKGLIDILNVTSGSYFGGDDYNPADGRKVEKTSSGLYVPVDR